jgi:type II secretory pathway predicted ATPase ExeA
VNCDPELTEERYEELQEDSNAAYTCVLCDKKKLNTLVVDKENEDGKKRAVFKYKGKPLVAPPLAVRRVVGK